MFKAERDWVLAAVKRDGGALVSASDELKADREVVLAAIAQHSNALWYASSELHKDPEMLAAGGTAAAVPAPK